MFIYSFVVPVFKMNFALFIPSFSFIFWIVSVSGLFLYRVTSFVGKLFVDELCTVNSFFWFYDDMSIFVRFSPVKYVINFDFVNLLRIISSINSGESYFP
jgi:hypothetical protein